MRIVTLSADNTARIWDANTGDPVVEEPLRHEAWIYTANFSADGARIVTASADQTARIWDAKSGKLVGELRHDGVVNAASFSTDGNAWSPRRMTRGLGSGTLTPATR
jgi:WD40 repeat protein